MPNMVAQRKMAERLGETVRMERTRRRLSQQEVAKLAGVSPTRVTEIENATRDPRLSTVESIVGALGMTLTVESAA
jgi:transcriptional regulator with XRE-family HTH domain